MLQVVVCGVTYASNFVNVNHVQQILLYRRLTHNKISRVNIAL